MVETIVIPDLDDDDFSLPSFPKPSFGSPSSSSSTPELDSHSHRSQPSSDYPSKYSSVTTPTRPILPKGSASYSVGGPSNHGFGQELERPPERPKLGKFSNGSSSSLVTPGTSISSTTGFLANRKGSLASLKNAFKSSASASVPIPPVPTLDAKQMGGAGYPALRNPFSRFESSPASPTSSTFARPNTRNAKASTSSIATPSSYHANRERKQSVTTNHSSQWSQGGRSVTSQGSSNFRAEDYPVPALPPIPMRGTPSRLGRMGSDAGSVFVGRQQQGSMGTEEMLNMMGKSPADEAVRVVFREFREAANHKITRICARPLNIQPSMTGYLDPGVDPRFDEIIASVAHCGRRNARCIVDLLNNWCRGHCEGISASEVRAHLNQSLGLQMRVEDAATILSGRKSSAARYILGIALIELVKTVPRDALGEELGMSLESSAFGTYRSEKLEEHTQFPHRKAVAQLQIELLGQLSVTRFLTVSDRFVRELGKYPTAQPNREAEARIEHLLVGLRSLKLRVYPETELEMSAEFIQALAEFFAIAHGQTIKCAYAEAFTSLLHPVIETATAEVHHPMWSKAVALILDKALAMMAKPRYWSVALPLVVVTLGVSPREVFMQHWQGCIETITAKLKDRQHRIIAINGFVRLLWIYLNRCTESATSMRKRLDSLIRMCVTSPDVPSEAAIAILHYVMTRHLDYGNDFIVEYLSQTSTGRGAETAPMALPNPDRAMAVIRASLATLRAVEEDRPATWPADSNFSRLDSLNFAASGDNLTVEIAGQQEVAEFLQKAGPAISALLPACDRHVGSLLISSDVVTISTHASSTSMDSTDQKTQKHGDVHVTYPLRYQPFLRLLSAIFDALPRGLSTDVDLVSNINILCRATFSADPAVCTAASQAMRRIAQTPNHCLAITNNYRDFIFETRHIFRDTFVGTRLLDSQFERVVGLWLDLLQNLVKHHRLAAANGPDDEQTATINITPNFIDKLDASALFLLCSSNLAMRKYAGEVFAAARDLEGQTRRPSAAFRYSRISPEKAAVTRVIQLYEATLEPSDMAALRHLPWYTSSDRTRIETILGENAKVVQRIAESEHPKDCQLWLAVLPFFVTRAAQLLPGPAAELRSLVTSTVLRLQGHVASIAVSSAGRAGPAIRSYQSSSRTALDIVTLAEYWRAYLGVLVVTMPEQPPTPSTPPVQRTKETVILTPDTIGSVAVFHYLTACLLWEDTRFRDSSVYALGAITQAHLRPASDILLGMVRRLADGTKAMGASRDGTRRPNSQGPLWTSVAHVFRLISPLILDPKSMAHLPNLTALLGFVKITHSFLSDRLVQDDYDLQSLRRSFCIVIENLTNALSKFDGSERFLDHELRGAIFKLCYQWCHVGRRPDIAKARESQTLLAAADSYRGDRDRAGYLDDLQAKTKLLSAAAAEAMAGLCQGKLISTADATPAQHASDHIVDPLTVLRWIRGMFTSSLSVHHETGRKALFALIKYNSHCDRLLDEVLHQSFGEGEQFSLDSCFFGVVANVISEKLITLKTEQIACLALSKLGHPVAAIRQRAFQLALSLIPSGPAQLSTASLLSAIGSSSPDIYQKAQYQMASQLATLHPQYAAAFLNECTTRLSQLEAPRRQATLSIIPPWLEVLDFPAQQISEGITLASLEHQVHSNLMYLAVRFIEHHADEIRDIFHCFAGTAGSPNTTALVKYLFEQGGKRKSAEFVNYAQKVVACLAQSPIADTLFEEISNFVEPSSMAALPESQTASSSASSLANLDTLLSVQPGRAQTFSTGHLALLFAGELLPYRTQNGELGDKMLTLLHVALVLTDNASSAIRDGSQIVLLQVLRAWIGDTSSIAPTDSSSAWLEAERKVAELDRSRSSIFWKAEDTGGPQAAFLAPPKMTTLVMTILGILLPLQSRLRQQWGELALAWATSCPIRHLACRSFQVFRMLSPKLDPRMVSDTLARLSSTIGSESLEIQSFNQEIIRTFATIVQSLTATEMMGFPQIFWCSMACLMTPFENEFIEVIELLSHVLDKTNLSDPEVVEKLASFRPVDWVGPEPHLQSLLLVGLRSSKTAIMTLDLIRRLASSPLDELIDNPDDRLLHGFIAALPWMLHSTDIGEPNEDLGCMALDLAAMADSQGNAGFSRLLTSFARARFRAKDDFVRQAASLIRDYMPTHALQVLTMLLGFVLNTHDWMREKSIQVLKLVIPFPETRGLLATHGDELLQPLLRLLSTKHSAQALDVLDLPVYSAIPSDTGSPALNVIFGLVSESGWSVANVSDMSALARENLTAVFNTCAKESRAASAHFSVVQFADIKQFAPNPSVVSLELPNSPPILEQDNTSMNDLVGALHSLNQFFDDCWDGEDAAGLGSSPKVGKRALGHGQTSSESISEKRVRAIMARAQQHTHHPSISSTIYETSPVSGTFPIASPARAPDGASARSRSHMRSETMSSLSFSDLDGDANPNHNHAHRMNSSSANLTSASTTSFTSFDLPGDAINNPSDLTMMASPPYLPGNASGHRYGRSSSSVNVNVNDTSTSKPGGETPIPIGGGGSSGGGVRSLRTQYPSSRSLAREREQNPRPSLVQGQSDPRQMSYRQQHQVNPSMSSISGVSDMGESQFGLDEGS